MEPHVILINSAMNFLLALSSVQEYLVNSISYVWNSFTLKVLPGTCHILALLETSC